jgi:succinate dehydrogenase flavin-adding protein (antitoxin of CptAB toxin-antitoxin module)
MIDLKTIFIDELGLAELPADKQEDVLKDVTDHILQAVMARAVDVLSEAEQDELEKRLETDVSAEDLFTWLSEKIPTFSEIVVEEIAASKKDVLSLFESLEKEGKGE